MVVDLLEAVSADGTVLAAELVGSGPELLLVHGTTADRTRWAPLVPLLQDRFRLVLLDRRGRGDSRRESPDYAIEREGEDVLAVLRALRGPAGVLAHSYGATCVLTALEAVADLCPVVLYEPPFATPGHVPLPVDLLADWTSALADGRRQDVLVSFYRDVLGVEAAAIAQLQTLPVWQARLAAVHTIVREGYAVNAFALRPASAACRLLVGDATAPFLAAAASATADAVAGADLHHLEGQGHLAIDAAPDLIARHLVEVCG